MTEPKATPEHTVTQAAVCFSGIILTIATGLMAFGISLHILLLAALIWTGLHAAFIGLSFAEIRQAMTDGIVRGMGAIYIFLLIGLVIASFIESGAVAVLIHYGLSILTPEYFLPVGLVLCSVMSLSTGTSWGTVATAGVVLLGIGSALDIPLPIIAGVVVSGASFGDKMSPVSDTTNLAAMSAGTTLNQHIRTMMLTTVPAYLLALGLFTWMGMSFSSGQWSAEPVRAIQQGLESTFVISPWAMLPVIVMIILSQRRMAPELVMLISIALACTLAVFLQGANLADVLNSLQHGYKSHTGIENLDNLLSRGGILNMMWTLSLSLIALALGGLLQHLGFVYTLMLGILKSIRQTWSLMTTTIVTGIVTNMCVGEAYLSIIMGGQIFKEKFKEQKLDNSMLSRCLEEGATLTTGLIPWTTAGLFYSATLDIAVVDYAPWALFNLLNPILSILLAITGFTILKAKPQPVPEAA
ncbi:Na+/H+ antiporter NhaC [Sansalvadorimonas sp. 2012CJ34-2]|uniref:Na+/H+ antiporter NhaC n=1 Tax=Parendozoicomonas callyspongiae TaxID=2942213 RepID=A0ABT0PEA5_9GAMM|nr:Na+/H+ antiporter NhaC [Sansalvadorimonas sp. 2012CJ34-2]MCL6269586.1 Na+/H+ antiporter NhaC [Sansalvadorimonas sp. 2012CJ34-2]